jgi:hypothetical protein
MSAGPARRICAATTADADDPFLRDRTWAVPFEDVWQAARHLVSGGLRGWTLTWADDQSGIIEGTARGWGRRLHDVRIQIALDADAQTFLRATVIAQSQSADLGRTARRLRRFLSALDRAVARVPRRGPVGRGA